MAICKPWHRNRGIGIRIGTDITTAIFSTLIPAKFQRRINVVSTLRIRNNVEPTLEMKQNPTSDFQRCPTLIQRRCPTLKQR